MLDLLNLKFLHLNHKLPLNQIKNSKSARKLIKVLENWIYFKTLSQAQNVKFLMSIFLTLLSYNQKEAV